MKKSPWFDLEGKICVITGAGGAIAGTLAEVLASEGVRILVLDIHEGRASSVAERICANGGIASSLGCNVLEKAQLEEAYGFCLDTMGVPDFLINGAGGNHPDGSTDGEYYSPDPEVRSFPDLPYEGMLETFKLNYFGTVLPCQVFSRGMLERKSGSIINIASVSALNPLTKVVSYSSAKAAVANFTKWLAVHYSPWNVRVNALAPGFIMTEQLKFLHVDSRGEYTDRAKKVIEHTPYKRYGKNEELAGAALWLLSDSASFTTGSIISVDGGFSSYSI